MAEYPEKIFVVGLSLKETNIPKAPWIKAKIGLKMDKFIEFANQHTDERGWFNMTLAESKTGTLYIEVDQYKREPLEKPESLKEVPAWKPREQTQKQKDEVANMAKIEYPEEDINPDDIPF